MSEIVPLEQRFTTAAAIAWTAAQRVADQLGDDWLGTEHLLVGILSVPEDPAARLLVENGASVDRLRARMQRASSAMRNDAALLATLGIDLNDVHEHVRATFGPDAVNRLYERRRGWGRRRLEWGPLCGRRLLPRLKRAIKEAFDSASRGDHKVDTNDLLIGLLSVDDGLAVELLRAQGVDTATLRAHLRSTTGGHRRP
jgi:ATP-dependent Clp protease ATP-binding subunit ClpA